MSDEALRQRMAAVESAATALSDGRVREICGAGVVGFARRDHAATVKADAARENSEFLTGLFSPVRR